MTSKKQPVNNALCVLPGSADGVQMRFNALLAKVHDEHELALVFHHAVTQHSDQISDRWLLLMLLKRVTEWRVFVCTILETILQPDPRGDRLLRYLDAHLFPLLEHDVEMRAEFQKDLETSLVIKHTPAALERLTLRMACTSPNAAADIMQRLAHRQESMGHAFPSAKTQPQQSRTGLCAFIDHDVNNLDILRVIVEHAQSVEDQQMIAATIRALQRLSKADDVEKFETVSD